MKYLYESTTKNVLGIIRNKSLKKAEAIIDDLVDTLRGKLKKVPLLVDEPVRVVADFEFGEDDSYTFDDVLSAHISDDTEKDLNKRTTGVSFFSMLNIAFQSDKWKIEDNREAIDKIIEQWKSKHHLEEANSVVRKNIQGDLVINVQGITPANGIDFLQTMKNLNTNRIKTFEEFDHSVYTNKTKDGNFWGTVGAGILPICTETKRILLPFRSKYVNEPHTWGVWGGKLDDMETNDPKTAARQEFLEESGFGGSIKLIPSYVFRNADDTFTYHNFIGLLDREFEPKLDWETESYRWVTFEELMKITPKHFGLEGLLKNDLHGITKALK